MPEITHPFPHDEYLARLARIREVMVGRGLDALWITDPSNMAWLTGYDGWSFYVHQGVLVGPDVEPFFWGREMDVAGALRTCWMEPENCLAYADQLVQNPPAHPMQDLASRLIALGLSHATIGVELDNYYYSAAAHAVLTSTLDHATFADATGLVNRERAVKSDLEIGYMRQAGRIVERMHAEIRERARPGLRKNALAAELLRTGILGTMEGGGDYPAIVPLMPAGADASAPHLTWDDSPFQTDTVAFFEIAGCFRRYHCPQCRTVCFGTPPEALAHAEETVLAGLDAAIDAARPGATAGEVASAMFAALQAGGLEKDSRCGYAVGLSYPPDWGERTISLRASDRTELEPGMTFHLMPGLWFDDWGLEITETILIRPAGPAECLADTPREVVLR